IAGAVIGLLVGGGILITFGVSGGVGALAGTLFVAAVLGGLAGALPPTVLAAALAATLSGLVLAVALSVFQNPLSTVLGGGTDIPHRANGVVVFGLLQALLQGLLAAIVAFRYLRGRDAGRVWPWYLLAGAAYGIVGLLTLALSRIGGAHVYTLVSGFSSDDA